MFTPKACQMLLLMANEHPQPNTIINDITNDQELLHTFNCMKQDLYAIKRSLVKVSKNETKNLLSRIHQMDEQTTH
jgi:hypothetical protein